MDFTETPCHSIGHPGSDEKCALFNEFVAEQNNDPNKKWAFEIKNTTALHEVIDATNSNIFYPNKQYWIDRIVREGGIPAINWCRSLDGFTPLHLVRSVENAQLLLRNGANPQLQVANCQSVLQKIACHSALSLPVRTELYRLLKLYNAIDEVKKPMDPFQTERYSKVLEKLDERNRKILIIFSANAQLPENTPLKWLPREIIHLIAWCYHFHT